ncbi:hypothetical protein BKA70DRAFT_1241941 [Coprinopsis sp. MPI-PUGE-AT-0042]|nr:hypothetical protein BKA70DRAFT_1241941 [Coprinopsis sp. MPI-PUGE-AT-0042]
MNCRVEALNQISNRIPAIHWSANNQSLEWDLLREMEKEENQQMFFGKASKDNGTSGDPVDHNRQLGDRVKGKIERMIKLYQSLRDRLCVTGGGLTDDLGSNVQNGVVIDRVTAAGPNETTPPSARNLWDQIRQEWPLFPAFHQHLGSRPNVSPVVITTALGPNGQETVWLQRHQSTAPSPSQLPAAPSSSSTSATNVPSHDSQSGLASGNRAFATDLSNNSSIGSINPSMQPPSALHKAIASNTKASASKHPHSVAETLVGLAEQNLIALQKKMLQDQHIAQCAQLLEEFKAGVWTREELKEELQKLDAKLKLNLSGNDNDGDENPRPEKRARHSSHEWDSDLDLSSNSDDN